MKKIKVCLLLLLVFTCSACFKQNEIDQKDLEIPVLIYHHFLKDDEKQKYEPTKDYSVSLSVFEEQMKYLHDNGYKTITLEQMLCWKLKKCKLDEKSVMITIDDGQKSVLEYAYPILKKYGLNAVSFIITSRAGSKEVFDASKYQYLSIEELINDETIEFGSHSHDMHQMVNNNKKFLSMTHDELVNDVKTSKNILKTNAFAFPFNSYNNELVKILKDSGYELAFRGQSQKTNQKESKYMISRIFVSDDMEDFKKIFESDKYNRKDGK